MAREIKFRVWINDRMAHNIGFHPYMSINLVAADIAEKEEFQNRDEQFIWSPGLCELMQFTGLKDKNGVDIYEGDILSKRAYDGDSEYTLITKIVFDNGSFCMEKLSGSPKQEKGVLLSFPNDMPTIIGNIYQNPELI